MNNEHLLVIAMAEECRRVIQHSDEGNCLLPEPLRRTHLLWMCDRIEQDAEGWPVTRLHRWIGFLQSGMMANRMLDLPHARTMFAKAKFAHATPEADDDLIDHLDPGSSHPLELGGES